MANNGGTPACITNQRRSTLLASNTIYDLSKHQTQRWNAQYAPSACFAILERTRWIAANRTCSIGKQHRSGKLRPGVTRKLRRNVGDKMSATDWHKMPDIVTGDMRMIDTGTTTVIAMSVTTENTPPDTTVAGRSNKVPTTTGPDKVTETTNASRRNVTRGRRIAESRLESTNGSQTRAHQ